MTSFFAGQRLAAAQLNSLTILTADIEEPGPTSGTTELLLTGSLVIPAASIDRVVNPVFSASVDAAFADNIFDFRIRETDLTGTIRAFQRLEFTHTGIHTANLIGRPFTLAADTSLTLVCTAQRNVGSGTLDNVSGVAPTNGLAVSLSAVE